MKKDNNIVIPPAYFLNTYKEGFYVEIPENDFSSLPQWGSRPFVLKFDDTHIVSVFKGADKSKLKYVYVYIYQLSDDGRWFLFRTLSDKVLTDYPYQEVTTQEELDARIAELREKVKALNAAQEAEIKLPINEFVKKHIPEIDTTRKLALFITKLMKTIFSKKHFVTEKQLLYFSTSKTEKRYKTFKIRKKNGGFREINAPVHHLNKILYILNLIFKSLYTPNNAVMGFTEGKSIADNATRHTGQHYVFNIDLKDFFTSIPQARVWGRIQCPPFNFSRAVANVVAGLCCATNSESGKNVLPQGAPTSPLLTNAICDRLDRQLTALSKKYGLHYSRYADDITFSSMHNVYQENSAFRKELRTIIEGQNFCINDTKTRLLRTGQRQEVTGLTVNSKVNVTRKYVKDLRYILHLWESKGYAYAYSKFYKFYKTEKGYIKKGEPVMENVIGGKLNYLRMIKGSGNECYQKLLQRYDKLQQIIYIDENTDKGYNYVYVQQYTLSDFENDFQTKITLQISDGEKLVGKCKLFGTAKTISISHKTQEQLCPIISHLKVGDTFNSELLKQCYITLCRQKGKNFWLITHKELDRSRCLSIQNAQIEPEKLLKEWEQKGFDFVVKQFQTEILKKSDVADYVSERNISEFIYFVTHSKLFDRNQKLQRDRLLARDIAKKETQKFKPMSVSYTSNFFAYFNKPDGLKYLTHDFDSDTNLTLPDLRNQSYELLQEHKGKIPESLYVLIYSYLSGKVWKDVLGADNTASINNKKWINWSKTNGNAHPITNPDFANGIYAFKSAIRIVPPFLQTLVDGICSRLELNITTVKLNKAEFYTNTFILNKVLDRILQMMKRRIEQFPKIEISFHKEIVNDIVYKHIIILQRDSCPEKPFEDVSIRLNNDVEAGDLGTIRKNLNGYCYWSIETKWDGNPLRWNILRDEDSCETMTIGDNEVVGFKHILTFMK